MLVGVVEVLDLGLRHGAGGAPAALDVAELGEGFLEVFAGLDQGLEVFDHGELLLVVLFLVLLHLLGEGRAFHFILAVKILEPAFDFCEGVDGDRLVGRGFFRCAFHGFHRFSGGGGRFGRLLDARGDLLLAQVLVESRFQCFGILVELLHVLAVDQLLEGVYNLLETLVRKIRPGVLRLSGGRFLCYRLFLQGSNRVKIFTHSFTILNCNLQI